MILYLCKGVNYYMKKRNTAIRALSVFLAYSMVCTSVPAAGQEMFGSGVNRETEENTSDLKEFQSSQADEFGADTGSGAELFGSDDAKQQIPLRQRLKRLCMRLATEVKLSAEQCGR